MALNGSELINNPFRTIFSPFTDLFGSGFWIIPLSFIAVALYVKTRNITLVGMYMLVVGILWSSGNIFIEFSSMGIVYILFALIGFISIMLGIFNIRGNR